MSENEFWDTTPRAFFNAIEGFESLRRTDLEIQRLQTFCIVSAWAKVKDPKKLYSFHWEKTVVSDKDRQLARHRARRLAEKFDRWEKRHGNE